MPKLGHLSVHGVGERRGDEAAAVLPVQGLHLRGGRRRVNTAVRLQVAVTCMGAPRGNVFAPLGAGRLARRVPTQAVFSGKVK